MSELCPPLVPDRLRQLGPLELAYVGDAVYELLARTHLAARGGRVGDLHRSAVAYVAAPAQAAAMERLRPALTERERRGPLRGVRGGVPGTA